ncbi:MAG: RluA family pseudouridine synthase [Firmicutes bacterium]|nr:RluA family pseudouridine synthase [Bacillota bacterium]
MKSLTYRVDEQDAGARLDRWLAAKTGGELTRTHAQRLVKGGFVAVNGATEARPSWEVRPGSEVTVTIPDPEPLEAAPEDIPLDVVYEDRDVLVVNKPRGLVVHPAAGNRSGTLVSAVLFRCGDLKGINDIIRPGIVHRLDKDTTGLMVIAKNEEAYKLLARQVRDRLLKRHYLAMVHGVILENRFVIEAPVGRHPVHRKRMAVIASGKPSATVVKVLERFKAETLVECELRTGRTHQIRVHMSHTGHPVLGDPVYCRRRTPGLEGQALHAWRLGFSRPGDGQYVEFSVEPPADFQRVLDRLRAGGVAAPGGCT